jgi:hypothetical protein
MDCHVTTLLAMTEAVVTASVARQSMQPVVMDCHVTTLLAMTEEVVASAPRNDKELP